MSGALLIILCFLPVGSVTTQGTASATTLSADSLRIAEAMAWHGENCVTAFALAARQLRGASGKTTAATLRTLSMIARFGGDPGTADILSTAALRIAETRYPPDDYRRARFLLARALALRLSGKAHAAERAAGLVEEGLHLPTTDSPEDLRVRADLLQAQANLFRASHDYSRAIDLYEEALTLRPHGRSTPSLAAIDNEVWLAVTRLNAGEDSPYRSRFLRCRAELMNLDLSTHPLMATIENHLAILAEIDGDSALARKYYQVAFDLASQSQSRLFPGFSRRRMDTPISSMLAVLQLESGDNASAWMRFARGHQRTGDQARQLSRARVLDPSFVLQLRDSAMASAHMLGEVQAALVTLDENSPGTPEFKRSRATVIRYAETMSHTLQMKDRLRRRFTSPPHKACSVARIQQELLPTQAILAYVKSVRHRGKNPSDRIPTIYAVVVRRDEQVRWFHLPSPSRQTLESVWNRYAAAMKQASSWPTRLPEDPRIRELLHQLYQEFFAQVEGALAGADEVLIYPSDLWSGFPFPALVDDEGNDLVERFSFRHLFGSDDIESRATSIHRQRLESLVLGDPSYDGNPDDTVQKDPSLRTALTSYSNSVLSRSVINGILDEGSKALSKLPRLPSSGWEARGIASMNPRATLLTGNHATEQELQAALGGSEVHAYQWIHLATHALMHRVIPERSALALSPRDGEGLLYIEELEFGWNLDCELVTLSGCQTGGGPASWSMGPMGFVQALRIAGARNLLLSSSKVDDISTALLMERFYANLANTSSGSPLLIPPSPAAPMSYSAALAEAQRWLRDLRNDTGERLFAHPVYWANFFLIGTGKQEDIRAR